MTQCICTAVNDNRTCLVHGWNPYLLRRTIADLREELAQSYETNRRLRSAIREAQTSAERKNKIIRDLVRDNLRKNN
jgi:hypothetical protein